MRLHADVTPGRTAPQHHNTLLVRYATHAGATVIGLAGGPEKAARVEKNGADLAIDYNNPNWPTDEEEFLGDRRATIVFDGVRGETARRAVALLRHPGGRHLVLGWSGEGLHDGTPHVVEGVSESVLGPAMIRKTGGPNPVRTLELRALAEAAGGRPSPAVHRFPLAEAAAAHHPPETWGTIGKAVLEP